MPEEKYRAALAHHRSGNLDQARQLYEEVVASGPASPIAGEAHHHLGILHFGRNDFRDAVAAFSHALRLNAGVSEYWCNLASALLLAGRRPEDVLVVIDQIAERFPNDGAAQLAASKLYMRMGEFKKAVGSYERASVLGREDFEGALNWKIGRRLIQEVDAFRVCMHTACVEMMTNNP